ncbi:MAG: hypothetical protein OXF41_09065 [bacterium]|nr:hypothetical protein [bacterium]
MADRGELLTTPGRVVDPEALVVEALTRWGRPAVVVADRWRVAELKDAMDAARLRCPVVVRGQGFRDGGADRDFRRAVLGGRVAAVGVGDVGSKGSCRRGGQSEVVEGYAGWPPDARP